MLLFMPAVPVGSLFETKILKQPREKKSRVGIPDSLLHMGNRVTDEISLTSQMFSQRVISFYFFNDLNKTQLRTCMTLSV